VNLKLAPSDYEIYLPIAEWVEKNIKEWLFMQRPLFKKLSAPIDSVLNGLETLFNIIPFPIAILIFAYFAYRTNGLKFTILTIIGLIFIDLVDLWSESMTTLAMIFTAVIFCIIIGIPLGILCSRSKIFETIMRPVLDGSSLGLTRLLILTNIEIPLALKTIMAGINQTLMLSLSMVVIAALIGAGGLGLTVYVALGRLDIGSALIGGTGIVILAIILDRITQKFASTK
jgi:glycine betaine/proline transport system permease protein